MNRRTFLKRAAITSAVVGAAGLGVYGLNDILNKRHLETSNSATLSNSVSTSSASSTRSQNVPLAVKDLNQQIQPYENDLTRFGNGQIADSQMKVNNPTYNSLLQNAESLREALRKYKPQNTEGEGQQERFDQMALGSLSLYSWFSRMLEDDIRTVPPIPDNRSALRACAQRIQQQVNWEMHPEIVGNDEYNQTVGKTFTDLKNETSVSPMFRGRLKTIYDSLSPEAQLTFKQMMESYNPNADSITDYKKITEENLGIFGLNDLLARREFRTDDEPRKAVTIAIENGTRRNSDLGRILNRSCSIVWILDGGLQSDFAFGGPSLPGDFANYIMSTYSELSPDHKEMTNYDFALAVMSTPTFSKLRKDRTGNLDTLFLAVSPLADRDAYLLVISPYGSFPSVARACIKDAGKYYWAGLYSDRPTLIDIAGKDFYGGSRKNSNFVVSESTFGIMPAIPALIYTPKLGIVSVP